MQVCIFARGEFVFPLRRPLSVALLLLSHVLYWMVAHSDRSRQLLWFVHG